MVAYPNQQSVQDSALSTLGSAVANVSHDPPKDLACTGHLAPCLALIDRLAYGDHSRVWTALTQ